MPGWSREATEGIQGCESVRILLFGVRHKRKPDSELRKWYPGLNSPPAHSNPVDVNSRRVE